MMRKTKKIMSDKVWMGAMYIKEEGGYKIILKSLNHYKKRLASMKNSPELQNVAMFAPVLHQQALKTIPEIDAMIMKIQSNVMDIQLTMNLKDDVAFMQKALSCYESDINKAQNTGHEYFLKLVNLSSAKNDLDAIKTALEKIKQYL